MQAACCSNPAASHPAEQQMQHAALAVLLGFVDVRHSCIQLHFTAEQDELLTTFVQLQFTLLSKSCSVQRWLDCCGFQREFGPRHPCYVLALSGSMVAVLLRQRAVDGLPLLKTEVLQAAMCCGCPCRVVQLLSITWASLCSPAEAWPSCSSLPWQTAHQMQGEDLHVPSVDLKHCSLVPPLLWHFKDCKQQSCGTHPAGPSILLRLRRMATANGSCSSGLLGVGGKPERLPLRSIWLAHRLWCPPKERPSSPPASSLNPKAKRPLVESHADAAGALCILRRCNSSA